MSVGFMFWQIFSLGFRRRFCNEFQLELTVLNIVILNTGIFKLPPKIRLNSEHFCSLVN